MELLGQRVFALRLLHVLHKSPSKCVPTLIAISSAWDAGFVTALALDQFAISHSSLFLKGLEVHFTISH